MEFNAFKVCDEVATRINGAPGPGGYLKGFKATKANDMFFNDKKFLDLYLSKSDKEKQNVPGYAYYSKVTNFLNGHCQIGMKYFEYVKLSCMKNQGLACNFCTNHPWVGPVCEAVPRPFPDYDKLPGYHYKHVSVTPTKVNGIARPVDDFQPRAKLKEAFTSKTINLTNEESVDKFCDKYIVDKKLVKDSLQHLHHLEVKNIKKQQERQLRSQREDEVNYDTIDWQQYYDNKCLSKLKVKTLDKYLLHNGWCNIYPF